MYTDDTRPHNRTGGGVDIGFQLLSKFCSLTVNLTPGKVMGKSKQHGSLKAFGICQGLFLWVVSEVTYCNSPGMDLHCELSGNKSLGKMRELGSPARALKLCKGKGQTICLSATWVGQDWRVMGQGKGLRLSPSGFTGRKASVLPLSTRLPVHNHSSSPHRQPWRRSSVINAISADTLHKF